jgi:hypothetical protein
MKAKKFKIRKLTPAQQEAYSTGYDFGLKYGIELGRKEAQEKIILALGLDERYKMQDLQD